MEERGRPLIQTLVQPPEDAPRAPDSGQLRAPDPGGGRARERCPARCTPVCVLASSRETLRVPGEQTYPVHPLPVPARDANVAALLRSPAVRLFIDRAKQHRPSFSLTARDAPAVAEMVVRLEGIPLALELAAARMKSMTVTDINTRLKDRFKLLTGRRKRPAGTTADAARPGRLVLRPAEHLRAEGPGPAQRLHGRLRPRRRRRGVRRGAA